MAQNPMSTIFTKNPLWLFTDDQASFRMLSPDRLSRLYFPLANEGGILSSITPDLHGDIKTSHNSFLTLPVSIDDLHDSKSSRNFWIYIEGKEAGGGHAWSATGVSARQQASKFSKQGQETAVLQAGMLWHKMTRENNHWGLRSEITNFAPASADTVEIMVVKITNTGSARLRITPTAAVPIFGRSADNLRDHHHVTSLLHRIVPHSAGVVVRPTMSFDERGHKINDILYGVLAVTGAGDFPEGSFSSAQDFIGEGGSFEAPRAILDNAPVPQKDASLFHGKAAVGAVRFKAQTLAPKQSASFVVLMGIAQKEHDFDEWLKKFGSLVKAEAALKDNKNFWAAKADAVSFHTPDKNYNGWTRWVSLQPMFRKIYGCSFLPDFDYGRGGRGWRDLWQDCLALLLTQPADARQTLINNFGGVRIDGSNATIIGTVPGEFIADRNNITRVWMDHGVWPYLTLELYIHQSGDFDILFQEAPYFRDTQQSRARKKDISWNEAYGKRLKDRRNREVRSSILEHILVQHLVQFFNVGEHSHIRLENADWNDGLDMAYERGESVAFSALYASNLVRLAGLLEVVAAKRGLKKVTVSRELLLLLDRASGAKVDYNSVAAKTRRLEKYFQASQPVVSGVKRDLKITKLVEDLRAKAESLTERIRQKEWIGTHDGEGLFNGYYDNHGRRVEGTSPRGFHMTLAGQVFPIMGGVASAKQVSEIWRTARKYLKDKEHGGFRLNTDFHEIRLDLGRAFSFAYGEKENGAFFSHMAVMFANALYQRGFVAEGQEVLESIYRMCLRTEKSRIYPGLPEYFNSEGRGMYHYLTGSASWLVLTLLTQVYGVRGYFGDLVLAPKLTKEQFEHGELAVTAQFAGRSVRVVYRNPKKIPYENYCVTKIVLNGKELKAVELNKKEALIPRELFLKATRKSDNIIVVTLE